MTDDIDLGAVEQFMLDIGREVQRRAAYMLAAEAQRQAPVDTGWLQASITVQESPGGSIIMVTVGADYAEAVEFGHFMKNGQFYPANPYFRRAIEIIRGQFPEIVASAGITLANFQKSGGNAYEGGRTIGSYAGMPTSHNVFFGATFTTE